MLNKYYVYSPVNKFLFKKQNRHQPSIFSSKLNIRIQKSSGCCYAICKCLASWMFRTCYFDNTLSCMHQTANMDEKNRKATTKCELLAIKDIKRFSPLNLIIN